MARSTTDSVGWMCAVDDVITWYAVCLQLTRQPKCTVHGMNGKGFVSTRGTRQPCNKFRQLVHPCDDCRYGVTAGVIRINLGFIVARNSSLVKKTLEVKLFWVDEVGVPNVDGTWRSNNEHVLFCNFIWNYKLADIIRIKAFSWRPSCRGHSASTLGWDGLSHTHTILSPAVSWTEAHWWNNCHNKCENACQWCYRKVSAQHFHQGQLPPDCIPFLCTCWIHT